MNQHLEAMELYALDRGESLDPSRAEHLELCQSCRRQHMLWQALRSLAVEAALEPPARVKRQALDHATRQLVARALVSATGEDNARAILLERGAKRSTLTWLWTLGLIVAIALGLWVFDNQIPLTKERGSRQAQPSMIATEEIPWEFPTVTPGLAALDAIEAEEELPRKEAPDLRQARAMVIKHLKTKTLKPTLAPTSTGVPTQAPSPVPSVLAVVEQISIPTPPPTQVPTDIPTTVPTEIPTQVPTYTSTTVPTIPPTPKPTLVPTLKPTKVPTPKPVATETNEAVDFEAPPTKSKPASRVASIVLRKASVDNAGPALIVVNLPDAQDLELRIFDARSHSLRLLHDGPLKAGAHSFRWNGRDEQKNLVPRGDYYARISTRDFTRVETLTKR